VTVPLPPAVTFETYLAAQPEWIRSLLSNLNPSLDYPSLLWILQKEQRIGVTDGSVIGPQGTFGWALASTVTEFTLIENAGPAYGARTEAYGQLSVVVFLNLLSTFFDQPLPEIKLYCDNKAVVDTVNSLLNLQRPDFPNDSLRPSWDLLQSLRTYNQKHPTLALGHILGHHDKNVPVDQLPLPARLNVRVDALAGAFQAASNHANQQGPMIPGTYCQLLIRGEVVATPQYD